MKLAPQRNLKISHTQEGLLPRSGRLLTSYFFRRGKFEEKKKGNKRKARCSKQQANILFNIKYETKKKNDEERSLREMRK